jgi:hypothetical protein
LSCFGLRNPTFFYFFWYTHPTIWGATREPTLWVTPEKRTVNPTIWGNSEKRICCSKYHSDNVMGNSPQRCHYAY